MISIIITTKNESKHLPVLLESIKGQNYKNYEVIVVDNDSTDNTKDIAKRFRAKIFNKGPERSAQRNFGAKKSSGNLLVFLDADMELLPNVISDCVKSMRHNYAALIIPEKTVGAGMIPRIRKFEREMYMNDPSVEVARVFKKDVFNEFGGYDNRLTGPEDFDLPYRVGKKYKIGRGKVYLLHHEEGLTLLKLLKKKYYYGKHGAFYATKHPELLRTQGNIIFRKAYFKNWRKFLQRPIDGAVFIFVRFLETLSAVSGYISAVGFREFLNSFLKMYLLTNK